MEPATKGWWNITVSQDLNGWCYGYKIFGNLETGDFHQPETDFVIADPYSTMVIAKNHHSTQAKTLIHDKDHFSWSDSNFVPPTDIRDLVIYETHIKDLVAHKSSKSQGNGIFQQFLDRNAVGGIEYLKSLGVNAVEFLPLQKFAYFEPPFMEASFDGSFNTWNYYGKNYWGYMTSFYFCPETIFASDGGFEPNKVVGDRGAAIPEIKKAVNELHRNGIAVIMDVVYNHVSQYDINPLRYGDINYYCRTTGNGHLMSDSGCGNDLKTENTETRRIVIESLKYWMKEFHIDGFRFDLANILDWETIQKIRDELREINPNVYLIAEPWGGGYDPQGFSYNDWASWNDQIRNGIKGSDPSHGKGFIFGGWHHDSSREAVENYAKGTIADKHGGRFLTSKHCVNYLESHDNHTLGDFIRIGLDPKRAITKVIDKAKNTTLSEHEMALAKIAAVFLFCSQGAVMIHAGQEWARSKIIHDSNIGDSSVGFIDHNSYEKDNETNWLNFEEIELNKPLFRAYKWLISFRLHSAALRKSNPASVRFIHSDNAHHIAWTISGAETNDRYDYLIAINAHDTINFELKSEKSWDICWNNDPIELGNAGRTEFREQVLKPKSSFIARKLRN